MDCSNRKLIRSIFVRGVAAIGVLINGGYGLDLLDRFFSSPADAAIDEVVVSAISLELGWAALLFWSAVKPFERRHVLLFTALSMLVANLLHSLTAFAGKPGTLVLNLAAGIGFAGLFVAAFWAAKPESV